MVERLFGRVELGSPNMPCRRRRSCTRLVIFAALPPHVFLAQSAHRGYTVGLSSSLIAGAERAGHRLLRWEGEQSEAARKGAARRGRRPSPCFLSASTALLGLDLRCLRPGRHVRHMIFWLECAWGSEAKH